MGKELADVTNLRQKHNLLQTDINTNREILVHIVADTADFPESLSEEGRQGDTRKIKYYCY